MVCCNCFVTVWLVCLHNYGCKAIELFQHVIHIAQCYSYYKIPPVVSDKGEREFELSLRRRDGYLAAISRADLDISNLGNYRICSRHFASGSHMIVQTQTGCQH